ncbi:hypothetical protein, partial [Leptospira noguchii]|uniref:hypothetical protein n=1 Tax=Leptospira noguchii TaxID=28182 RepID=UPI0009E5D36C
MKRFLRKRLKLNTTLSLTQRLASMVARQVALWVVSHFNYEICELRRRPVESRCIEFIIRPNFLT